AFGGLLDQARDRLRLRDEDRVTGFYLDDGLSGARCHQRLGGRRNHLVVRCQQIPAGLRPPCRFTDRAAQRIHTPRHLRVGHERRLLQTHVASERRRELRLVEQQVTVNWRQDRGHRRARHRVLDQRRYGLTLVGGEGGDIYQPHNLRIIAGFGDDRPAVRVADENDRAVL